MSPAFVHYSGYLGFDIHSSKQCQAVIQKAGSRQQNSETEAKVQIQRKAHASESETAERRR